MIQGLILAAGTSSRLGQAKQLLEIKGQSLLELAILSLLKSTPHVLVLLGAETTKSIEIIQRLQVTHKELSYFVCESFLSGMGSTLSEGLRYLKSEQPVLIHLVDLPLVNENHFNTLIDHHLQQPEKAIISSFRGQSAPPILIPSHFLSLFFEWQGEKGLGQFWKTNPQLCEIVDFDEDFKDVDTMEDYWEVIGIR
ncbi:nucleotidyltransferase family protein [Aquirufa sp. ROCK2-A2]